VDTVPNDASNGARARRLAVGGVALVLAGVLGYFVVVFRLAAWLPSVRNDAVPNWIIVSAGVVLSLIAVVRGAPGQRTPAVLLGVNVGLVVLFAVVLYVVPVVPAASGPAVGAAAPDFALVDHTGKTVRLADYRGAPLLLVFYRGHW
jgi:hypothetical protein